MDWIEYIKRLRASLNRRVTPRSVVFHHVPKCGGTSVGRSLRKRYILSQTGMLVEPAFDMAQDIFGTKSWEESWSHVCEFREQFLAYHMHAGTRCISAHIVFSRRVYDAFQSQYAFMTVLREPVARFVSHYHYTYAKRTDMSLANFLKTDEARNLGVRYVEYFHGMPERIDLFSDKAFDLALSNLECFDILGILEEQPQLLADMESVLGFKPKIGHDNKRSNPHSGAPKQGVPSEAELNQIKRICAPDIKIYQRALAINEAKNN